MATNLTTQKIKDTFAQVLHIDGGPEAAEKAVYGGTGVATALKVGTGSASVDNVQFDGNTIRTLDTDGNLTLAPNGTGSVAIAKAAITGGTISGITDLAVADGGTGASDASGARTNLGLGAMATQAASAVAITGGTITGITDLAVADGGTGASTAAAARTNLGLGTMATQAASAVAITGGMVDGAAVGGTTAASVRGTTVTATTSLGYPAGTGGAVTQITSKSTSVTLDKVSGQITMHNAALAASTGVTFTLTNSFVAATDVVVVNIASGATPGVYTATVDAVATGSCTIHLHNHLTGPGLSEAVVLNFAVIKGAHA